MQSRAAVVAFKVMMLAIGLGSLDRTLALAQSSVGNPRLSTPDNPVVALNDQAGGQPQGGALHNRRIAATWQIRQGHLTSLTIRDTQNQPSEQGKSLLLEGPFSIALKDAGVLPASALTISGSARVEQLTPDPAASRVSDRLPGVAVHYPFADPQGRFQADWAITLRQGSGYIRQTLTLTAGTEPLPISDLMMIDVRSAGIGLAGTVRGSPLTVGDFYLGFESPLAESSVVDDRGVSELHSGVPIGAGLSARYSSVVGVAPAGQMRRSFLAYLERERAHPYRTFLHYNSWFDLGFFTPYTQQNALNRIHAFGKELHTKRGVTLDSFLFDDGWDNLGDLWKIRPDFKDGFMPLKEAAAEYGAAPGIWLSPWGGYGPAKQERLVTANKAGYEIVDGGLALSGPRYFALFHDAVTGMVANYGVNQFKFDGTGNASQVVSGSAFSSDFDAAIHLIGDLRRLKPDLYVNLTTGTWPSPFWLFHADSIWRGGDDTSFAGVGSDRERWITYRDAATYDKIVKAGRLFPLNSLMLHGIVLAEKAPHLSSASEVDFSREVRSYFGSGTQLQELYISPSLLTSAEWDVLAEAAKWSRQNAATLADTHWVGGDPGWLQVYGWAAWSPQKAILTLRNPSSEAQEFPIDIGQAFELPAGAAQRYVARSPWANQSSQPATELEAGKAHTFRLEPFEVLTLEAQPQ
jgi:hypothetical protein